MNSYLVVALGSAIGGVARHWCGLTLAARLGTDFPWGTLVVNVSGSFLIGVIAALVDLHDHNVARSTREFLMVGVLGGYTTFSAFSLQTLTLLRDGRIAYAAGNVVVVAHTLSAGSVGWLSARHRFEARYVFLIGLCTRLQLSAA